MTERRPVGFQGRSSDARSTAVEQRDRFRHNLARLMAERRITQAGLARSLNVSRVAVHAWIWGTCFPETARLLKLAKTLNVPIGALLEAEHATGTASDHSGANEEALLLDAFRKLPNTARLSLLADAYEMSSKLGGMPSAPARARNTDAAD